MGSKNVLLYGVGVVDADYVLVKGGRKDKKVRCPFYAKWQSMLLRCYGSPAFKAKAPTYDKAFVCEEWLTFSNFKSWMETQDWEGKQLDKDLLVRGNKEYSPDKCVFITPAVNVFIATDRPKRQWPSGVVKVKNRPGFNAQATFRGEANFLGYYRDPYEAHQAWLNFKIEKSFELAQEIDDIRVAEALINRYKNYDGWVDCTEENE